MINVYHRADHDCIITELKDETSEIFIHHHKDSAHRTLREIIVKSLEGEEFAWHLNSEPECDQSRRR